MYSVIHKIEAPKTAIYLSEFMSSLPDGILNKKECGCGATHLVLTNEEPTIVAVPTVDLIKNKCKQLSNVFGMYGGIKQEALFEYLDSSFVPKIMVTYDSLPKLIKLIKDISIFNLVIDEYHQLLTAYSYRDKAIDSLFEVVNKSFNKVTFLSATPIEPKYSPTSIENVKYTEINWPNAVKVKPTRYKTNKPFNAVVNIIKKFRSQGNKFNFNGHTAKELYFFVNSVVVAKDIIDGVGLINADVKVICSDTKANREVLDTTAISDSTDPNKPVTFITSKAYQGCDFYSETGLIFVVSNNRKKNTLVDVSTDLFQISGRIRTLSNPFKHTLIHIYNTSPADMSREEFEKMVKEKINITNLQISSFNKFTAAEKAAWRKRVELDLEDSYSYYNSNTDELEFNQLKQKSEEFKYEILNNIYTSGLSLRQAYIKAGFDVSNCQKWIEITEKQLISSVRRSFEDVCKQYIKDIEQGKDVDIFEKEYPLLKQVRLTLGIKAFSSNKYKEKNLKEALYFNSREVKTVVLNEIRKNFKKGKFYPSSDIKIILQSIYKTYSISKKAKASDLSEYINVEEKVVRIEGKSKKGYIITSNMNVINL